jgi:hypothetical protein
LCNVAVKFCNSSDCAFDCCVVVVVGVEVEVEVEVVEAE